jgi:hypothetical protein
VAVVVAIALAAVAIANWVTADARRPQPANGTGAGAVGAPSPDRLLELADEQADAAGCGPVIEVAPYPDDRDAIHVEPDEMPPLSSWPSIPPASGPHESRTLPAGAYGRPPPILPSIHSLEHGAAVIWYSPEAPRGQVSRIARYFAETGLGTKVIVAPYDYPDEGAAGHLPDGAQMALVAWHRLRLCARVDLAVAFAFTAEYASPPYRGRTYLGEAPEPNVGI